MNSHAAPNFVAKCATRCCGTDGGGVKPDETMRIKRLFSAAILSLFVGATAVGQTLYDVTDAYLKNTRFDSSFDHKVGETGNVESEMLDIEGWLQANSVTNTIVGTWQLGTALTFDGASIPATGFDGTSDGGVLVLLPNWASTAIYYQQVTLPPGTYYIVTALWNATEQETASGMTAWIPTKGKRAYSSLRSYPQGQWLTDTVSFTLTAATTGKLQVGHSVKQTANMGSRSHIVYDFVKLLRDTELGQTDIDVKKESLAALLSSATETYGDGSGTNADQLKEAIDNAQTVCDNSDATIAEINEAYDNLNEAIEDYEWENSGVSVTTDPRYARGSSEAFGRMTVEGIAAKEIAEQGFCWSTSEEPTIDDATTQEYLSNNGNIYWITGLEPATKYYMRAYVLSKAGRVKYGETIKFYTIPEGKLTYNIRDGGTTDQKTRITNATVEAVGLWNKYTQLKDVNFNVGYNDVPTADCSYGGYIRVGSNTSYQKTGTLLHEMLHGVGVIPWAGTQWSKNVLRASLNSDGYGTGYWLGDRVSEVLRFWDNTDNSQLNGDYQHMWPYGINGAHEDTGTKILYIGNSLVCEALAEDGLETSSAHHALPYYAFDCEDDVKYYIKNESESYGLKTAFLTNTTTVSPKWIEMSADEAELNDSAAWYVTFTPDNQLYQFRNVATGKYLSYYNTTSVRVVESSSLNGSENFQLMRGRVDVTDDGLRGYWFVHPMTYEWSPRVMSATTNGKVAASALNLANTSKAQRWLILTADQMRTLNAETDGIRLMEETVQEDEKDTNVYDLQGRKQNENSLMRGIYVRNGKKYIVR